MHVIKSRVPARALKGIPSFNKLNEPVMYGEVTADHITQYADITLKEIDDVLEGIRGLDSPGFENVFVAFDNVINDLSKASSSCFMFYWVSPDSIVQVEGPGGLYAARFTFQQPDLRCRGI